jgi:hypothetical protein
MSGAKDPKNEKKTDDDLPWLNATTKVARFHSHLPKLKRKLAKENSARGGTISCPLFFIVVDSRALNS